ncbi:MAG: hypothetical protein ACAI25_07535 [Planctomycetota bacterium]
MERELDPSEKRLPVEPAAEAAPRADVPRTDVKVAASLVRCPYCHSDVAPDAAGWVACEKCLARHHTACWDEGGRCSTCGATARLRSEAAASKVMSVIAALLALGVALLVAFAVVVPVSKKSLAERANTSAKVVARNEAIAELGQCATKLASGDLDGAQIHASRAIEQDPGLAQGWHDRARVKLRKGDAKGALDDVEHAFRADPDLPPQGAMFGVRAEAKLRLGDLGGAIKDAEWAVELVPGDAVSWRILGAARLQNAELEVAVRALTKAIELDEKNPKAYRDRAVALEKLGRPGAARSDWACVLELVPPSSELADEAHAGLDRSKK